MIRDARMELRSIGYVFDFREGTSMRLGTRNTGTRTRAGAKRTQNRGLESRLKL